MWVWRSLGYDSVSELPSGALSTLGRRCRKYDHFDSAYDCWDDAYDSDIRASGQAPGPAPMLAPGEEGDHVEIFSTIASPQVQTTSTYRLEALRKLRLCIPGALVLEQGASQSIEFQRGGTSSSFQEALHAAIDQSGASFVWKVPCVEACLRQDIADECCFTPGPTDWPSCVTGATFGAEFEFVVIAPWPPRGSPTDGRRMSWVPMSHGQREEPPIECDGFKIQFLQRGGPPLNPRRLNGCNPKAVSEELSKWVAKQLCVRPDTWCTLCVQTKAAQVSASVPAPMPAPAAAARRQTGDIVVAVTAETEIALEPFELSYGDAHISSLQRMVEDEVAHILGIPSSRVLCGDFTPGAAVDTGGPRKLHIRRDTLGLRFALLHTELAELIGPKELPMRKPSGALPSVSTKGQFQQLPPIQQQGQQSSPGPRRRNSSSVFQKELNSTLKAAGVAMGSLARMSKTVGGTGAAPGRTLTSSQSAPMLGGVGGGAGVATAGAASFGGRGGSPNGSPNKQAQNNDLPPDLLLKRLVSTLADPKHPCRRHPDVFPMLARLTGKIRTSAVIVVDRSVVTPGKMAEDMRALLKGRASPKREMEMDPMTREKLIGMRSDLLRMYAEPGGAVAAQQQKLISFSAKELLDEMEGSASRPLDLQASLRMLIERTATDVEWCMRLRSHRAVERILSLAKRFNSEKAVMSRALNIIAQLTANDQGCVDRLIEKDLAPIVITALDNFPQDKGIQFSGCQVLRRLYIRARESNSHGSRVVILGKKLPEVWTFKGLERVLAMMRLFADDPEIQAECCRLLASLAEIIYNNGMASEAFKALEVVMRRHSERPDILAKGVLIIARLGPSFLQHERRGVISIVQALSRHRSNVELQRVGMRALIALGKEEKALQECRSGGCVATAIAAMAAHSKDEQVIREGTRALERLCPRALDKAIAICGDLAMVLPSVSWMECAQGTEWEHVLDDQEWDSGLLKNFREDFAMMPRRQSGGGGGFTGNDEEEDEFGNPVLGGAQAGSRDSAGGGSALATISGYRRNGLREEFDSCGGFWATSQAGKKGSQQREKDINSLKKQGCGTERLRAPGPTQEQLKKLCEALQAGLTTNHSAQDGELLACMIGHFAWCSANHARDAVDLGGAQACMDWLRSPIFCEKSLSPEETALSFAMQRGCLCALSSICMHDSDLAGQIVALGGVKLALDFATYPDVLTQRSAMRLLARLMPIALSEDEVEQISEKVAWELTLRELRNGDDEISRTCAAACALEIVKSAGEGPIVGVEGGPGVPELASAVLSALSCAVQSSSPAAGLPLLLAVGRMLDAQDDAAAAKALISGGKEPVKNAAFMSTSQLQNKEEKKSLVQLLAFWLPKGIAPDAKVADKAAATAAAMALKSLSELEAPLPFREMRELMVCGQSTSAEPALRDACADAVLLSVERSSQPQQLAHLFATSVGKGRQQEERLAEPAILKAIMERIVHLLRSAQGQATEVLVASLRKAERMIPEDPEPSEDVAAVRELLEEALSFVGQVPHHNLSRPSSAGGEQEGGSVLDQARGSRLEVGLITPRGRASSKERPSSMASDPTGNKVTVLGSEGLMSAPPSLIPSLTLAA